jgi:small-conductance mechanosensitive channel
MDLFKDILQLLCLLLVSVIKQYVFLKFLHIFFVSAKVLLLFASWILPSELGRFLGILKVIVLQWVRLHSVLRPRALESHIEYFLVLSLSMVSVCRLLVLLFACCVFNGSPKLIYRFLHDFRRECIFVTPLGYLLMFRLLVNS